MTYCSACGFQNDDTAKFCKKCGESLGSAATASASVSSAATSSAAPVQPAQTAASVVTISGGIVSWPSTFIVQSYIEKVTTHVPLPKFPKPALLLLLLAIVCMIPQLAKTLMPVGFILLLVAVAWIVYWVYKRMTAPKGITIYLNSGDKNTIYLRDHTEANRIVDAIRDSLTGEQVTATINFTAAKAESQEAVDFLRKLAQ